MVRPFKSFFFSFFIKSFHPYYFVVPYLSLSLSLSLFSFFFFLFLFLSFSFLFFSFLFGETCSYLLRKKIGRAKFNEKQTSSQAKTFMCFFLLHFSYCSRSLLIKRRMWRERYEFHRRRKEEKEVEKKGVEAKEDEERREEKEKWRWQ
uniref:Uncharacterized protein n=1 Tax=Vespula pensylvanica TaxID=30213 RepID=A0A834PDP9_VESPE|nr:hypothetical protein H0235_000148 [Vespula pensylvanica]